MSTSNSVNSSSSKSSVDTFTNASDCDTLNAFVGPLLTDLYHITMCYGYFKAGKQDDFAVFDLFFRRSPFSGEFTIFAGLGDCLKFVETFRFSPNDIAYLKTVLPKNVEPKFYDFLSKLDCTNVKLYAVPEGTVVFPRVPLIIIEGPLAICQLLETTLLNLVNYASLVTTNAARFKLAAGDCELLEFGLRRAQGPDGAVSASKYAYIGGFDGTSNVLAGQLFGIPVRGTHAHSFVSAFEASNLNTVRNLDSADGNLKNVDFTTLALQYVEELCDFLPRVIRQEVHSGELAAFIAYAVCFPNGFLGLIDTYDALRSGVVNFCACALALHKLGYRALGIRIDSGDLAYLSKEVYGLFVSVGKKYNIDYFAKFKIVASNDINEDTIYSLNEQKHKINCFGVGTHLVTCQKQPALGCVYKLVELNGTARIKLSQDVEKITIPGRKRACRLYGRDSRSINDLLILFDNELPEMGTQVLCRHPFIANKRAFVTPTEVQMLHKCYWSDGHVAGNKYETLREIKERVNDSLRRLRDDVKRCLNPTPYKVSVNERLFEFLHSLWQKNAPIGRLE